MRWDTKPDKRIRRTFATPDPTAQNAFLCRTEDGYARPNLPLIVRSWMTGHVQTTVRAARAVSLGASGLAVNPEEPAQDISAFD